MVRFLLTHSKGLASDLEQGEFVKTQSGFTLIELLLVLAIIGIISAIAIPALLGQRERAKMQSTKENVAGILTDLQGTLDQLSDAPSERRADLPPTDFGGDLHAMAVSAVTYILAQQNYVSARNPYQNGQTVYVVQDALPVPAVGTAGYVYISNVDVGSSTGGYIHIIGVYRDAKGTYTGLQKDISVN
jgi:prepilin-type N-terminal cleavage/methylation domain-containing protein